MTADGPRIAIVGAGGWVFPMELIRDMLAFPALQGSTIALYDIDVSAAKRTERAALELIELGKVPARIEVPTDLHAALTGADFVVTVFQVGSLDAYGIDVEIPREYGIDQTVGDTRGPGGIFRGLRSVPALRLVAETMLDVAPGALLLNYANPMSVNCWATDLLGVDVVGLCHSIPNTAQQLARELGVRDDDVTFEAAGVNHTAWFTTFRRGNEDLIPKIREVMVARYVDGTMPRLPVEDKIEGNERVRTELMMLTGYFHAESSHHASEYWAWFRRTPELIDDYLDERWDYLAESREVDPNDTNQEIVEEARREGIVHGGEQCAPIMDSIVTGTPRVVYGNVRNGGSVENLSADACVEVPCKVDGNGVRPVRFGTLPPACAALNEVQIASQRLTVQAAMTGDSSLVHAAVALDPLTSAC